jgi:hypothetical protein
VPVFECYLQSIDEKVKFRSFTVKEEKILLVAKEDDDVKKMILAVKQVMGNCLLTKVDLDRLAFFDFEFLFLNIRSKSIGDVIPVGIVDVEEKQTYKVDVNIESVKLVENPDHERVIKLTDKVGLIMKYPTIESILDIANAAEMDDDVAFDVIKGCIESVYEDDKVFDIRDSSKEEVDEFFNSLSSEHFTRIQKFFDTMPRLRHEVEYVNKLGEKKKYVLEDVSDFF